jgi:hypothetical protein
LFYCFRRQPVSQRPEFRALPHLRPPNPTRGTTADSEDLILHSSHLLISFTHLHSTTTNTVGDVADLSSGYIFAYPHESFAASTPPTLVPPRATTLEASCSIINLSCRRVSLLNYNTHISLGIGTISVDNPACASITSPRNPRVQYAVHPTRRLSDLLESAERHSLSWYSPIQTFTPGHTLDTPTTPRPSCRPW